MMKNPEVTGQDERFTRRENSTATYRYKAVYVGVISVLICLLIIIYGLSLSAYITEMDNNWTAYDEKSSQTAYTLAKIERKFGYGGFIHNLKNYVLRKDPELVSRIEKDLREVHRAIDEYPDDSRHAEVSQAVSNIRNVLDEYSRKFELAKSLVEKNIASNEIDRQIRVDDRPAIVALSLLNSYVLNDSRENRIKTQAALNKVNNLLMLGWILLPVVLITAGIIILYIRHSYIAAKQISDSSQYLTDLFEAAPDAMLIVDTAGKITSVNHRSVELLGYSREEFCELKVEDLMPERFRGMHVNIRNQSFDKPKPRELSTKGDFYALKKNGDEIPVEISLSYTLQEGGMQAITVLRDVSERKQIETILRRNENMLSKAQQVANIGSWEWNITANSLTWSDEIYRIFGLKPGEFGASYDAFVERLHPDDREDVINAVNESVVYDKPYDIEHRVVRPDGEVRFVMERGDVFRDADGEAQYMIGTIHDITEQKQAEKEFKLAENVFNHTSEGIMITDEHNRILRINQAFTTITGYTQEDVFGQKPNAVLKSGEHDELFYAQMWSELLEHGFWEGEIWDKRKDGKLFPSWHNISAIKDKDESIIQFTSIFSDITDKKIAEEHIQHLAQFDQLTKLPNRMLFNDRLYHALSKAKRARNIVALMFIDLDRFKSVNDTLGHQAGDQLLQAVSHRLLDAVREQDTVARLGGDEFTIILEDLRLAEDAAIVANKVLESLSHKVTLGEHEVTIGGSIGISIYPEDGHDTESMIKNADMAMYQAKNRGKNCYQYYTTELASMADARFHTENRLRRALVEEEFELYYQPQVDWEKGYLTGAEALIRWNDPQKGLIVPAHFITLAEEMGLIDSIGEWVLITACRQAVKWQEEGYDPIRISVNVSSYQIMQGSIVETVQSVLEETGLNPEYLELEITESFVMEHPEKGADTLDKLKKFGITIAIDDFGTGYSSLSYLKQLSINRLKIDRSFVMDIPRDKDDEAIVSTIISMAKNLGLSVIAEGVEHKDQIKFLNGQGCTEMQGYYFGKPLHVDEFEKFLANPQIK